MLHVVHHADYMAPAPTRGTFRFDKYMAVMVALRDSGYRLLYPDYRSGYQMLLSSV